MKKFLVGVLTLVGAALVVSSGFISNWDTGAVTAILLEVGAALLLVPVLFWGERQLEARIEQVRAQVREEVRGLRAPGDAIRLEDPWEDAHAHLERHWHLRIEHVVTVQLGHQSAWFGFATMRQFNQQSRQLFSPIYTYFQDPTLHPDRTFDAYYEWRSGVSLGAALDGAIDAARHHASHERP